MIQMSNSNKHPTLQVYFQEKLKTWENPVDIYQNISKHIHITSIKSAKAMSNAHGRSLVLILVQVKILISLTLFCCISVVFQFFFVLFHLFIHHFTNNNIISLYLSKHKFQQNLIQLFELLLVIFVCCIYLLFVFTSTSTETRQRLRYHPTCKNSNHNLINAWYARNLSSRKKAWTSTRNERTAATAIEPARRARKYSATQPLCPTT
jgi:predicted PurR-regulated permease PerM